MANHQMYKHCDVVTSVDKENNTVNVEVSYKEHIMDSLTRHRYSAQDVLAAVRSSGIPVAEVLSGRSTTLDNRSTLYVNCEYVFSLIPRPRAEKVEVGTVASEEAAPPTKVVGKRKTTKKRASAPTQ